MNSALGGDFVNMDTSQQGNSVHWPRNIKYYFTSPGDMYNNLGHSSHTSPVNLWPRFPFNIIDKIWKFFYSTTSSSELC